MLCAPSLLYSMRLILDLWPLDDLCAQRRADVRPIDEHAEVSGVSIIV